MPKDIWDSYANWAEVAKQADYSLIKQKILGVPEWSSNPISAGLSEFFNFYKARHHEKGTKNVCALDFGCGLGRNAQMLRSVFPSVIAVDIPEMTSKLQEMYGNDVATLYDGVFNSFKEAATAHNINIIYDSIVLQHIVDIDYLNTLMGNFRAYPSFDTVISISYRSSISPIIEWLIQDDGFKMTHVELDHSSFSAYHTVRIIQRMK